MKVESADNHVSNPVNFTVTYNVVAATSGGGGSEPPPSSTNTASQVSVAGVEDAASYDKGSVPAATCEVTDTEDGNSSFAATLSAITGTYASDGIGSQTVSCSYTDAGGLTANASKTYTIVDPSTPSIGYVLNPVAADGDNSWYKSSVSLTWSVSEPQSPNSLQKTGCVDQVISTDQQATTYSCSASSAGGSAGPVSVSIKRDATAPTIQSSGATHDPDGANGWYQNAVTNQFAASDATSGLANPAQANFTQSSGTQEGSAVTINSGSVTDSAGNINTGITSGSFKIDLHDPEVARNTAADACSAPGSDGWCRDTQTAGFTASDAISGLANANQASFTQSSSTNGAEIYIASGSVSDNAGRITTGINAGPFKIDSVAPSIAASLDKTAVSGWFNSTTGAPTVSFQCSDATSGIATGACPASNLFGEGANQSKSGSVSDIAGNSNSAGVSGINVDTVAPTNIAFVGGPAAGQSYYYGDTPAAPTCTADDATSGLKSCVVSGYSTAVGSRTLTATATDNAGNVATATRTYNVAAWTLKGFYAPVDMSTATTTVYNTVKNGSTVPLKFEVFKGATELTDTSIVSALAKQITCGTGSTDDVEVVATGSTSLRYDTTAGQFVYNWQTPKLMGNCYSVTMTTQDGSSITAFFKLK